jgi:GNAT superfamily N-acetyltransferase
MTSEVRLARPSDVPGLVTLMQEFYAEAGFPLASDVASRVFGDLLANSALGSIWLAEEHGEPLGHLVWTVCYSMEYGGLRGFIDDLYVRPSARGRGIGAALLAAARKEATERGVRVLNVEVGSESCEARGLYSRSGFAESGRLLLTLPLAPAAHET